MAGVLRSSSKRLWLPLRQNVNHETHHQLIVLVESFVAAADDAAFVPHDAVGLFHDIVSESNGMTWAHRPVPNHIFDTHASTVAAAITHSAGKSLHVGNHQLRPDRSQMPARGHQAAVRRIQRRDRVGADTEHDVTVTREDHALTLIFGMGTSTVQTFERVGPGEGEQYALEQGSLAFVDGYLILVEGDESSASSAYGTFEKDGEN